MLCKKCGKQGISIETWTRNKGLCNECKKDKGR